MLSPVVVWTIAVNPSSYCPSSSSVTGRLRLCCPSLQVLRQPSLSRLSGEISVFGMRLTGRCSTSIAILCLIVVFYLPSRADGARHRRPYSAKELRQKIATYHLLADTNSEDVQACDERLAGVRSHVYCNGNLLQAVNYHEIFTDSKTFVDMPMKEEPQKIIEAFQQQFPMKPEEYTKQDVENLKAFLKKYFLDEGKELDKCVLKDWRNSTYKIDTIKDERLRQFALHLNGIWAVLCRKIKEDVKTNEQRYSLIYVPNQFVAPGGRFREFYYWDAYWIVKGLLISGLNDTTRDMINNFAYMIEKLGFVPNGGRVYYMQRSQPPFFIPMVYEYYEAKKDIDFVKKHLTTMEKEIEFWEKNRKLAFIMNDKLYHVYQYLAGSNVPRPESYKEDANHAKIFENDKNAQRQLYKEIASIAESGWDFSSRWFEDPMNLTTAKITKIVPVDLNALMCWNFRLLSYLAAEAGEKDMASKFKLMHENFTKTFKDVFYVKDKNGWYDYHTDTKTHNTKNFYPSMAIPLFTECYEELDLSIAEKLYNQMSEMAGTNQSGGIPTSLIKNNQQWDYPNGWSPLNHMVIEGLRKSNNPLMQEKAFELARKWVRRNYEGLIKLKAMWEKYDVSDTVKEGGGGEYTAQEGFGWTNGVILDLLVSYADRFDYIDMMSSTDSTLQSAGSALELSGVTALIASIVTLALGLLFV